MKENKEENILYMYFIKDGQKYAKSMPLEGDRKILIKKARIMAETGILTWRKVNKAEKLN